MYNVVMLTDKKAPKQIWSPTHEETENLEHDMRSINAMYNYRAEQEEGWTKAQEKWNQINNVANSMYIPITRMITQTGIIMMNQKLPKIGIIPEDPEDNKIVEIIQDLNDHYDRLNGMPEVYGQVFTDYAVLGNAVIEDYIQYAYVKRRTKVNGVWKETFERDFSRPKVATRARSPWECAFEPGTRTISEVRACTFTDIITYTEFQEIYDNGKNDIFMNTEYVEPGILWKFNQTLQEIEYDQARNNNIVITHFQDERLDVYRIYANGVLIMDESLREFHAHGKITLSLITNHHTYDANLQRHALYGKGDPFLVEDLDDFMNAIMNQFVRNYEAKNTNIISVQGGSAIDTIDISGNEIIQGDVRIQALGQANLGEFEGFKSIIEEFAIQHARKNYKRLEGEVAKTAYEARQKQQNENLGIQYQLTKIENIGLKAHYQKRVSDMMEYGTEEEIIDISDITVADLEQLKAVYKDNITEYDTDGKPLKISRREKFRTKGRSYSMAKNRGKLKLISSSSDGVLTAHEDFIQTREFKIFKQIPEIYIVAGSTISEDKETKYENLTRAFQLSQAVAQANMQFPDKKWEIFEQKAMEYSDIRPDEILTNQDPTLAKQEKLVQNIEDVLNSQTNQQASNGINGSQQASPSLPQQAAGGGDTGGIQAALATMA